MRARLFDRLFGGASRLGQRVRGGAGAVLGDVPRRSRMLIVVAAVLVCAYALGVIGYVLSIPDIGIRFALTTEITDFRREFLYPPGQTPPARNEQVVAIGDHRVDTWAQLLRQLANLRSRPDPQTNLEDPSALLADPKLTHARLHGVEVVRVDVRPSGEGRATRSVWCRLGRSPVGTLAPTILWFCIKAGLFAVGALVFWQRPRERSARMFFLLCLFSCGAYLGGYHWQSIATQPVLLLVFMFSGVLLPAVSLHFYLVFPRPKPLLERRPWLTLGLLYVPPLVFLVVLLTQYGLVRQTVGLSQEHEALRTALLNMLTTVSWYLVLAMVLYVASLVCLVYGYRTAENATERNQVKWILYGASTALLPLGYSLYLALWDRESFGVGEATWPMFFASLLVTVAFGVSITRYRLMQLDQLVSSGFAYFAVSALAALVYYGLVVGGMLLLGRHVFAGPSLAQAVGVAATVLVLTVLLDLARGKLKRVLDRRFRREKNQLDLTLQRMSQAVAQLVDAPTLARRLLRSTADLLGAARGAVYLREGDPALFRLADALGAPPPLAELPPGCPLVESLRVDGVVRCPAAPRENGHPAAAVRQLQLLGGEVAHALAHEGRLLALLVLGPRAEGPYTPEDVNLLSAFAQVTALALVSGEGGRTIEGLNRELQAKVEKIAEQQRRILALQSQLSKRSVVRDPLPAAPDAGAAGAVDETRSASGAEQATEGQRKDNGQGDIVGSSPALRQVLQLVRKFAASGSSSAVLLRGESGTGKELLARALHDHGPRARMPFVRVHCAALNPSLLESELFGHVKGAFTGAVRDRPGRFELAHGGTLFLDEIGDVSWEVQTKLLRVLQEKTFERVGSSEPVGVDVRIIAATHQNLEELIRQGRFREDLFYRLNGLPIHVPPLRERPEDVPELVQHFLRAYGQRCGRPDVQVDDDALALLKAAPWPGNVRQLGSVIERAVVIAEGPLVTAADLPEDLLGAVSARNGHREPGAEDGFVATLGVEGERAERDHRERDELVRALAATKGNKAEAARALGLARSTLVSRLKKHGLS